MDKNGLKTSMSDKPRVLVHLHCFYPKEVSRYTALLSNIQHLARLTLVATISKSIIEPEKVEQSIKECVPDVQIMYVENLGYDMGPFMVAIHAHDLNDYDYILKLHTKARGKTINVKLNKLDVNDDVWVDMLIDGLIRTPDVFCNALDAFEDATVGMVSCEQCIVQDTKTRRDYYKYRINDELEELGLQQVQGLRFASGTMFMVRANIFKPLLRYTIDDFGRCYPGISDYTLAHTFERLFSALVLAQGYEIKGMPARNYERKLAVDDLLYNHGNKTLKKLKKRKKKSKKKNDGITLTQRVKRKYLFTMRGRDVVAASPLFDAEWYRNQYPEIGDTDPALHYFEQGFKEGKNPSRYFDTERYFNIHRGCKRRGYNPLVHYELYAKVENTGMGMPSVLDNARIATIKDSPLFDAEWYLKNNPDIRQKGADPVRHYLYYGAFARRDPSPFFCNDEYFSLHPDVRRAKMNPLYHYLIDGYIQGHELSTLEVHEPVFPTDAQTCSAQFETRPNVNRRTAIVATYAANGKVSDDFLYLLNGLRKVADNIVVYGDSPLCPGELDKLSDLVCYAVYKRHGQYDFGSYKRGLRLARKLGLLDPSNVDELIIMNDSCYGPVYPFRESFDYMSTVPWDFWGYYSNVNAGAWHICSNFYVFNSKVIQSKLLDEFFMRVQGSITRGIAIEQFEIKLSVVLRSQGMVGASLIPWEDGSHYNHRNILTGLTRYRLPLIKKKSISGEARDNIHASLEIIKRDNPTLYSLMDKRQRTFNHKFISIEEHQASFRNITKRIREKIQKGQAAKVLFFVNDAAMFPALPLFELMLSSDQFDPYIIIIPDMRFKGFVLKSMERAEKELLGRIDRERITRLESDRYMQWPDVTSDADIVCYPSPYDLSKFKYNARYAVGRNFLPIIFNYGYYRSIYDREIMAFYSYAYHWKVFVECEENLAEYREYSELKGANASMVGYVKMDRLARVERQDHERPRVLVALHHSVDGGFNDSLSLANFVRYHEYFLGLPDKYPGVDFVYRPHPALAKALLRLKGWNTKRVDEYMDELRAKPNVIWSDGGDYFQEFADSDACIQDCGSFLVEYLYTGKPCCYMLKDPSDIDAKFAPLGKECLEQCYLSYSTADIDEFIDDVVLGGNDPKAEGRAELAKRVMVNYPHAAEAALEDIVGSIMNASEPKG